MTINQDIVLALYALSSASPLLTSVAVFFAEYFPYVLIIVAAIWALPHCAPGRMLQTFFSVFAPAALAWFLVDAIKWLYPIARPFRELGFTPLVSVSDPMGSFPSGHATAFAALGMTIFLRSKKAGAWFLVGAFVIGVARIAVGVHYPLDILTGFLLGGLTALLAHHALLKFSEKPSAPVIG